MKAEYFMTKRCSYRAMHVVSHFAFPCTFTFHGTNFILIFHLYIFFILDTQEEDYHTMLISNLYCYLSFQAYTLCCIRINVAVLCSL